MNHLAKFNQHNR